MLLHPAAEPPPTHLPPTQTTYTQQTPFRTSPLPAAQVMEPADMLYLHGKDPLKPGSHTYIITGDSGQGMTGGTIGGMLVADLILGG